MALIHNESAFTLVEIEKQALKFGFANPLVIELFLWDLEITAQLQNISNELILKGGAAVQLFLPVEKQRGSVDIDITTSLNKSSLDIIIKQLESKIPNMKIKLYQPKQPNQKLNMLTYLASIDSVTQQDQLSIKIDIMFQNLSLPIIEVNNVKTFAVTTSKIKCYSQWTLIGDKILTLAKGSVGLKLDADYPKQIYDISMLIDDLSSLKFEEMIQSIEKLTPIEAKNADITIKTESVLNDIMQFIDNEISTIDTSSVVQTMKSKIDPFEQFYPPRSQRVNLQGWSLRGLRIRFIVSLAQSCLAGDINYLDCELIIRKAYDIDFKLQKIQGKQITNLRIQLLSFIENPPSYFKELRGKPLSRIFWLVATSSNLDSIGNIV